MACAWILAAILATPVTIFTQIKDINGVRQCWIDFDRFGWQVYTSYVAATVLVIPALIIAIFYIHIVYTIWRKAKLVTRQQEQHERDMTMPAYGDDCELNLKPTNRESTPTRQSRGHNRESQASGANFRSSSQSSSDSEAPMGDQLDDKQQCKLAAI